MDFIDLFRNSRKIRKIASGQTLFRQGEVGTEMFVVLEGSADILVGKTIVEIVRPGGIVGEMALIDDEVRSATVVTRTACELVALSTADYDRLLHERPDFGRYVLKIVVQRLRRMNQGLAAAEIANEVMATSHSQTTNLGQSNAVHGQLGRDLEGAEPKKPR
jgi:CRP/FNR family cyclic AMP-dependent transcriptional regulator